MNWTSCSVGDLVESGEAEVKTGPFGTQLRASDYVKSGTPVINVRNIGFGSIRKQKLEFIAEDTVKRLSSHLLRPRDIVFGRKGAVERHVFIQEEQNNWFQGSDCLRLRFLNERRALAKYLSYSFLTHEHQAWMMQQCSHGATMASLNQDIIKRISLSLPPLSVQYRITSVLSAYDNLIENNKRRIEILEEMARRVYEEWFVHFRLPEHEESGFDLTPIGDIAEIIRGRSYRSSELAEEGGRPFVNLKCVNRDGGFRRDGLKGYEGKYKEEQLVRRGDIVMAVTDMTQDRRIVARAALVPELGELKGIISMDLVKIEPKGEIPSSYLYAALRWSDFSENVKNHATGANVLHLHPDLIKAYQLRLPHLDLCKRFAKLVKPMFDLCETLEKKSNNLRIQRDLLLPKLISGEIDVSNISMPDEKEF
ncbi:restriction endonuclease subunit S [Pseudomonas lactucae]|uniref:restriction endonuclease subunit S n=1 Tax=Pseudomonas lactucae TaxID=2813360 RepID=UPI002FCD5673